MNLFPVIRLTEMKYIMAEYYARNGNVGDAYRILNEIRENRGIYGSSLGGSTWNNLSRNYSMMRVASGFLKDNCFACINV